MIGDDLERDDAGPRRAGIMSVWIDRAGVGVPTSTPIRPDPIISSLTQLL